MLPITLQSRDSFCLICCQLARKELNLRPASYKDAALTAELRASASWVGGIRTHASLIKSQVCSRYTTTQQWLGCMRLHCRIVDIELLLVVRVAITSGSPENRTQRDDLIGVIRTTSPRLPLR